MKRLAALLAMTLLAMTRLLAGASVAESKAGREGLKLMTGPYWPRTLELTLPGAPPGTQVPKDLVRIGSERGETRVGLAGPAREALPGAGAGTGPRAPGARPDAKAARPVKDRELSSVQEALREARRAEVEVGEPREDYIRMTVGRRPRTVLRPLLLFLVERGVIQAGEIDRILESDSDVVLERIRACLEAMALKRSALEVRHLLLEERERGER